MNTRGQHAMETMRNHDPESFSQIQDPEGYFSTLGDQIQEQIWQMTESLLPQRTEGQDAMEFIGRSNMARVQARELVYQEMIYASLPAEPEQMEEPPEEEADEEQS